MREATEEERAELHELFERAKRENAAMTEEEGERWLAENDHLCLAASLDEQDRMAKKLAKR